MKKKDESQEGKQQYLQSIEDREKLVIVHSYCLAWRRCVAKLCARKWRRGAAWDRAGHLFRVFWEGTARASLQGPDTHPLGARRAHSGPRVCSAPSLPSTMLQHVCLSQKKPASRLTRSFQGGPVGGPCPGRQSKHTRALVVHFYHLFCRREQGRRRQNWG